MKAYLCPQPGCYAVVPVSGRYCPAHAHLQAAKDKRDSERATARWDRHHARIDYAWVWHDPRWRQIRAERLRLEPNCRRCGEPGSTVDHVKPHRGDEALAFDLDNTQTLCERCSAIKSREDRSR